MEFYRIILSSVSQTSVHSETLGLFELNMGKQNEQVCEVFCPELGLQGNRSVNITYDTTLPPISDFDSW